MYFENGYALLIGSNVGLPIVEKDVEAIYDILIDKKRAAYRPEHIIKLLKGKATKKGILDSFDELKKQISENANATAIIYYSGHGGYFKETVTTSQYYLIPEGYEVDPSAENLLMGAEFTLKIEEISKIAQKLIVILDCCHAAGIPCSKEIERKFVKSNVPPQLLSLASGSGFVVIASSHDNEQSYYGENYSCFTECLLEGIRGECYVVEDGHIKILELLSYLFENVPKKALPYGIQRPFLNKIFEMGENFSVCLHNGGGKVFINQNISDATETIQLNQWEKERFKNKLEIFNNELNVRTEKVHYFRDQLGFSTPEQTFNLKQLILREEVEISKLEDNIRKILISLGEIDGK